MDPVTLAASKRYTDENAIPQHEVQQLNFYWAPYAIRAANAIPVESTAYALPITVPSRMRFDRIRANVVTTPGGTGALLRLGIYRVGADAAASTLVVDGGTVDATTTGEKLVTIDETLEPGAYYLVCAAQGSASPRPTMQFASSVAPVISGFAGDPAVGQSCINVITMTGVTGALPATFAIFGTSVSAPFVALRRRAL